MKKSLILTLSSIFTCLTFSAQIGLTNMSVYEENAKYVYSGKINVLYLTDTDNSKVYEVKIAELSLEKTDLAQFSFVGPYSRNIQFDIYENGTLIKSENFTGRRIPDPEVRFGNMENVTASVKELLELTALTIYNPSTYKEDLYISEFILSIFDSEGQIKHEFEKTNGCFFTSEQLGLISVLQPGDRVEITESWIIDSQGISRKKSPFSLTIK